MRSSSNAYYDRRHLPSFSRIGEGQPELAKAFFGYYGAVFEPGEAGARVKALAALAVAHVIQCPYCIDAYTSGSLEKGADLEQLTEAVHVAAAVRAGSTLAFARQAWTQAAALELRGSAAPADAYFDRAHQSLHPVERDVRPELFESERTWSDTAVGTDGALDTDDKAFIAVACAHALQCPYSIEETVARALGLGLEKSALTEAVHVATAIRGGASLIHGLQMLEQVERTAMPETGHTS